MLPAVTSRPFGTLPDGSAVTEYTLQNGPVELRAITYGGIITSLRVPDRRGDRGDVVLGHATLEPYLRNRPYFGAIIGRYANRIAGGRLQVDGVSYQLATNDAGNHLHGGARGFDQHVWRASPVTTSEGVGVSFTRTSPADEEHYPGTVDVSVTYLVTPTGTVVVSYEATTDSPTIVNLTQHTYFNLAGETSVSVLDHELRIDAAHYTPVDASLIPTGEIAPVDGTPFDFRAPARLRSRVQDAHEQLRRAGGFDHNFVLTANAGERATAATLRDRQSGRVLGIDTTEPGLQFYDGHLLEGGVTVAHRRVLQRHAGLCLETQHFPDSPNKPGFPSVMPRPHERYRSSTAWRFTTE